MSTREGPKRVWSDPPFRPFFVFAVLDLIAGVGVWIPTLGGWGSPGLVAGPVATWHARELLFSALPAVLSGFLLTALPRWTGRAPVSAGLRWMLLALWLSGPASQLAFPAGRAAITAAYLVVLTGVVAHQILRAGNRRNIKILVLVGLLAGAGLVGLLPAPSTPDLSLRMAIGAILGLVMVLAGRIIPSLAAVHLDRRGKAGPPPPSRWIEAIAAATAAVSLAAWIATPDAVATAWLGAAAAAGQAARGLIWQPWRTASSASMLALHGAYACIPLGFAGVFLRSVAPGLVGGSAVLHVWAVGAVGLVCVAVMASMIRRHLGRPLTTSRALNAAFLLLAAAVSSRTAAEAFQALRGHLLLCAASAWIGAHLLFLCANGSAFLPQRFSGLPRLGCLRHPARSSPRRPPSGRG